MVVLLAGLTTGVLVGPFVVGVAHLVIAHGPMVEQLVDQTMGAAAGQFAAARARHLLQAQHLLQARLGSGAPQRAI